MNKTDLGTQAIESLSNSFNINAVVRVGSGRGLVLAGKHSRFVITAAQCLGDASLLKSDYISKDSTFTHLLGPLGADATVAARCIFADSIRDLAVLAKPDPNLSEESRAFLQLTERVLPFSIQVPPAELLPCFLLSREQQWFNARADIDFSFDGGTLWCFRPTAAITDEMVGSPILAPTGSAIAIVTSSLLANYDLEYEGAPNPVLTEHLPAWFLAEVLREERLTLLQ